MPIDVLTIVQNYYVGSFVRFFQQQGVFALLRQPRSARWLGAHLGLDHFLINASLSVLAQTTGIVINTRNGFQLSKAFRSDPLATFHLEKFLSAYGQLFEKLDRVLENPRRANRFVDLPALASAFERVGNKVSASPGEEILTQLGVNTVVDLGCGSGHFLLRLHRRIPRFRGWGIDRNPHACLAARKLYRKMGVASSIKIRCGRVENLRSVLPVSIHDAVEAIHASSVLNEFSDPSPLLRKVKSLYPGRVLVVEDYYGELGTATSITKRNRQAVLQDIVQVLSGQGIPPRDDAAWRMIYERAGCILIRSFSGKKSGVRWLCHIVQL